MRWTPGLHDRIALHTRCLGCGGFKIAMAKQFLKGVDVHKAPPV